MPPAKVVRTRRGAHRQDARRVDIDTFRAKIWTRLKKYVRFFPVYVILVFVAAIVLLPLVRIQVYAFHDGMSGFIRAARLPGFRSTLLNTLSLAMGSTVIAVFLGAGLGWLCEIAPRRLRNSLTAIPLVPLVIPAVVWIIGWQFLLSPRVGYINQLLRRLPGLSGLDVGPLNVNTMSAIVVLSGISLAPLVFLFVIAAMRSLPGDHEAAAATCGAGTFRRFRSITLPLIRPALVYSTIAVGLIALGQFTAPLILGRTEGINVLTTEMFKLTQVHPLDRGMAGALGTPLVVVGLITILFQRMMIGDVARYGALLGRHDKPLATESRLAAVPVIAFGIIGIFLPLMAIVHVAVSPFWSGQFVIDTYTSANILSVLQTERTASAIRTSLTASALATLIVVPAGVVLSMATVVLRGSRATSGAIDVIATIPLAMPAAMFGLGALIAYTQPPVRAYGTPWIIILVYVTLMVPYAVRFSQAGIDAIGRDLLEASASSGAGSLRTMLQIVVPLSRSYLVSAMVIVFVLLSQEFGGSVFVRSARVQVMSTVLYDLFTSGTYPRVAAMGLIMVVVTAAGVLVGLAAVHRLTSASTRPGTAASNRGD